MKGRSYFLWWVCVSCDINMSFCTVIRTAGTVVHMQAGSMVLVTVLLTDYMLFVMQIHYKEDYEKNKGRAFTQVADDPEMIRVKKTQQQVSGVSVRSFVTPFPSSSSSYPHKSQPSHQTIMSKCPSVTSSCVMNLSACWLNVRHSVPSFHFVLSVVVFYCHFCVNNVRKWRIDTVSVSARSSVQTAVFSENTAFISLWIKSSIYHYKPLLLCLP